MNAVNKSLSVRKSCSMNEPMRTFQQPTLPLLQVLPVGAVLALAQMQQQGWIYLRA